MFPHFVCGWSPNLRLVSMMTVHFVLHLLSCANTCRWRCGIESLIRHECPMKAALPCGMRHICFYVTFHDACHRKSPCLRHPLSACRPRYGPMVRLALAPRVRDHSWYWLKVLRPRVLSWQRYGKGIVAPRNLLIKQFLANDVYSCFFWYRNPPFLMK